METTEKTIDVLNDLIKINTDRAEGFEKAAADLDDANIDLKVLFDQSAEESRDYITKLAEYVGRNSGETETGSSIAGTLHRAWIDIKATFGGSDRHSILAECERGEDAIKKAYKEALEDPELTGEVRSVLADQQQGINASHDRIKALRDAA
ncbi:PA2169 family four-helix-bundle protein [Mucilaginibacter myungsuensis]|uniref:PA2169 family four-helix-bundle protein n=1 Tax=Mucilaginibacter myungsuensis TaxID=649104 RepID=A0A929L251_9SPHI|nr:PA2169 family four-helix-bundle protein [Mucilaginibacter myungsuensis]MBE9662700.1 PA2169 family four-helix-bundle protein [Mucilaginibacter myungsuensis]MDN3598120.1 PA2169 family four-helix-bundle protein [Mucilaginibacter myungsuensis]